MKRIILIILIGSWASLACSQSENNIWHFGFGAGLDFSTGVPIAFDGSEMFSKEGCASICNSSGQLLFYTNGLDVWSKNNEIMPNGTGLLGGISTSSTNQALIVPFPHQPNKYYIFTTDERADGNGVNYSTVDMTLNSGLGDIVSKNTTLYQPSTERLTLARHSNGTDFWLITHTWDSNEFWTYLIDAEGIHTEPIISAAGSIHAPVNGNDLNARGMMQTDKDGNRLAVAIYTDSEVELFSWNSCDGRISNPITINNITNPYGLAFSPNGKWLYITNLEGELYQYDIQNQTTTLVGQTQGEHLGAIQPAPDGKLYVAITSSDRIGIIHQPDLEGSACQFEDLAIDLGNGVCAEGLPSMLPTVGDFQQHRFIAANIGSSSHCKDENIVFSIESDEAVENVVWQFEGQISIDLTPSFVVRDTGFYPIMAMVSNECKADTLSDTIYIEKCDAPIFVPNVFSPNNDGINDLLEIYGDLDLIEDFEMMVFSRWGDRLFYTNLLNERWNGYFNGKELGEGVYVWVIKVKYFGISETKVLSGDVTLMR